MSRVGAWNRSEVQTMLSYVMAENMASGVYAAYIAGLARSREMFEKAADIKKQERASFIAQSLLAEIIEDHRVAERAELPIVPIYGQTENGDYELRLWRVDSTTGTALAGSHITVAEECTTTFTPVRPFTREHVDILLDHIVLLDDLGLKVTTQ